jgi:hypothetical protein
MLTPLVVLLRSVRLMCCGHRAIALENLALRQQVAALKRTVNRPQFRTRDRLFWVVPTKKSVLVVAVDVADGDGFAFRQ